MKLTELDASFRRWLAPGYVASDGDVLAHGGHAEVKTLGEADGVMFLCPKCFNKNQGAIGTHRVICWFVGKVPDDLRPGPGRWTPVGASLDDLTFVPRGERSQSVLLLGGCGWHGFVTDGGAT